MPPHANLKPQLNAAEVDVFLAEAFPQLNHHDAQHDAAAYQTIEVFPGGCTVRLNATERHLRPGGTVSGAALFMLADIGGYVCVLSHAGPDALSVTTNLSINFMRKTEAGPIDGHCRILKLGKSLMVFDVDMVAGPGGETVAHAVGTYSIPPRRARNAVK
ncbi:PaaI family thioesterase [Mesorhizobium sp. BAC0120]|uniref:PaaI family thioesterase n=1 Tax=Mesorhizobium sp. BAC0120 TaxID=3090670 RepID=UPI00298D4AF0|nr:PaaI family thioesterase [Mesorhizobium sp. BAC0120]MDW6021446.1 PaaI family thioesterase [Mesorhizobium sp. BAC0120]